jgi:quinol monooxygenase YgiN
MAIYFVIKFQIKEGNLNPFKEIAQAMIASTKKETGTLAYEWHFSSDNNHCRLLETYKDQAAVKIHEQGEAVKLIPKLLESASLKSFDVLGDPGPEATKSFKALGAEIYLHWQGLERS